MDVNNFGLSYLLCMIVGLVSWGQSHDGSVNCVRATMSKRVSEPKTFVAANAVYPNISAGHDTLKSTFIAVC